MSVFCQKLKQSLEKTSVEIGGKTLALIIEEYLGRFLGIVSCLAVYLFAHFEDYIDCRNFYKDFIPIGIGLFGFLFTILVINIQGTGDTIKEFKNRKVLYERFIKYNKKIVLLAFSITGSVYILSNISLVYYYEIFLLQINIKRLVLSIILGAMIWLACDVFMFVRIFYALIKR